MEIGTTVHFVPGAMGGMPSLPYRQRRCIPAIVTRDWGSTVNLVVFPDGSNDLNLNNISNPLPIRLETSVAPGPAAQLEDITNSEWHSLGDCPSAQPRPRQVEVVS